MGYSAFRGLIVEGCVRLYIPCLTAAMLLAQAIYPPFAAACACRDNACVHQQSGDANASCCCAAPESAKRSASPHCSHCTPQSPATVQIGAAEAGCHCGDHSPQPLIPEGAPGSSHAVTLSWVDATATSAAVVNVEEIPADAQLPHGELLTPNFRHIVLCVWLA